MQPATDKRQFHIKSCLGRGGFGEVYRATMVSAGGVSSDVAVKVLHKELDPRSQSVERLRDEARLLGILRHPNILKVSDLVLLEDRVALIAEYVEGADLDVCLKGSDPVSLRGLIEAIGRVADALHAAHTSNGADGEPLNLVHRDIKPSNIRISKHGVVKLLDFGIAKATDAKREAKTQTNALIGSFLYMAPERFDGDATTSAVDVYALGATLYEGLTGEQLFADLSVKQQYFLAFDQERHDAGLHERFDAMTGVNPDVMDLLRSLLAYEASGRPTTHALAAICDDMAEDLDGVSLRKWARNHDWPVADELTGPLDGRVITETGFTMAQTMEQVVAPRTTWATQPAALPAPAQTAGAQTAATAVPLPAPSFEGQGKAGLFAIGAAGFFVVLVGAVVVAGVVFIVLQSTNTSTINPDEALVAPVEPATVELNEVEPVVPDLEPEPIAPIPAPIRVVPRVAPVVVVPVPRVEPKVEPKVEPTVPKPVPTAVSTATVRIEGATGELRDGRGSHSPGTVPAGSYEVWVDFGSGMSRQSVLTVKAGQSLTFRCSKLKRTCTQG